MRLPETGDLAATQSNEEFMAARQLLRYVRAAMDVGARLPVLLDALDMDEADLRNPTALVPTVKLGTLIRAAQREIDHPLALYKMGKAAVPHGFSDLHYAPLFMPNLSQLLEKNIELQAKVQSGMRTQFELSDIAGLVSFTSPSGLIDLSCSFAEMTFSLYLHGARDLGFTDCTYQYVQLTRPKPKYSEKIEQWLGCPVQFGAKKNVAAIGNELLYRPIPGANRNIIRYYEQMVFDIINEKNPLLRAIQFYLLEEMDKSPVTLARTAFALGMTERTLRRRIREEGGTFRNIIDTLRQQLCRLYITEGTRSIEQIAQHLGYSETSAFTRAHLRWYGSPPSRAGYD